MPKNDAFEELDATSIDTEEAGVGHVDIGPSDNRREWGDRIDLWVVGGQSNAAGRGEDLSKTPDLTADVGLEYVASDDALTPLEDPTAIDGNGASAWPAFADKYYKLTGIPSCITMAAIGGTGIRAESGSSPHWGSDGTLRYDLVEYANSARDKLESLGYDVTFRGVLWSQGGTDAVAMNDDATYTERDYQEGFEDVIQYFDGEFNDWQLYLFENTIRPSGDTAGRAAVRRVQRRVSLKYDNVFFASGRQKEFRDLGFFISDGMHYSSEGYNIMGREGAARISGGRGEPDRTTELPVDDGLQLHYDPFDLGTVSDGEGISEWRELGGSRYDATQSAESQQPTLSANGINNSPALSFDGANDYVTPDDFLVEIEQPFTAVAVTQFNTGDRNYIFDSNVSGQGPLLDDNYSGSVAMYAGSFLEGPSPDGEPRAITALFDGADSVLGVNGDETTGDAGTQNLPSLRIGARSTDERWFNGLMGDLIFYNGRLDVDQRSTMVSYLMDKYAI